MVDLTGYKLTFDDEFNTLSAGGPGASGITWETSPFYRDLTNGGQGTINPTPPGQSGSLFDVANGVLTMTVAPNNAPYLDTNPGGVAGGFSQQYGYFEMRAKLTGASGFSDAFWLMPNNGPWPPEIDIEEHHGSSPNEVDFTNHGGDISTTPDNYNIYNGPDFSADWHTYGLMWTPTTITWYLDGVAIFSAPTASNEQQAMNIIVSAYANQGLGWVPDAQPGTSSAMQVDWVHAYSTDNANPEIAGQAGYQNHDGSSSLGSGSTPPPIIAPSNPLPANPLPGSGGTVASNPNELTPTSGGSISDGAGTIWTLTAAGVIEANGSPVAGGAGTSALAYESTTRTIVGQDASSGMWYSWNGSGFVPGAPAPSATTPDVPASVPPTQPVIVVDVTPTSGGVVIDGAGNSWTLSAAGDIYENGNRVPGGGETMALAYEAGTQTIVGQDANSGTWYSWTGSSFVPGAPAPTPTRPVMPVSGPVTYPVIVEVITPTNGGVVIDSAGNSWTLSTVGDIRENGVALAGGGGTSALAYESDTQTIVGQDANSGGWYSWTGSSFAPGAPAPQFPPNTNGVQMMVLDDTGASASVPVINTGARSFTGPLDSTVFESTSNGETTISFDSHIISETVQLGLGTQVLSFLHPHALSLTGGSGQDTVTADSGTNIFTAGTGTLDVTGGSGASTYVFHANSGVLKIESFNAAGGDKLVVDQSLKAGFQAASDGNGGTAVTFGTGGQIELVGQSGVTASNIVWT